MTPDVPGTFIYQMPGFFLPGKKQVRASRAGHALRRVHAERLVYKLVPVTIEHQKAQAYLVSVR